LRRAAADRFRLLCSFRSIFAALESDNAAETLGFFTEFPGKENRELFFMIMEISERDQGILEAVQGSYLVSERAKRSSERSTDAGPSCYSGPGRALGLRDCGSSPI